MYTYTRKKGVSKVWNYEQFGGVMNNLHIFNLSTWTYVAKNT